MRLLRLKYMLSLLFILGVAVNGKIFAQKASPGLKYSVSMPDPSSKYFLVELKLSGWNEDSVDLKMPQWMPGYYQLMNYSKNVEKIAVVNNNAPVSKINENTWRVYGKRKAFTLTYQVKADKQFVANSYLDSDHGYIIPASLFFYIDKHINLPVSINIKKNDHWKNIVTGLMPVKGTDNEFTAPDFDILYDCPILLGNLEELPSFKIKGIEHRFIGYNMDKFDHKLFMTNLKKVVEAGVDIIGDIPYKEYTFIGIGPGRGGIEHLNNTTVSFDGKGLDTDAGMNKTMNFLAHEYFHHYNVKRIRPFELGPFDYDKGSKTNLLWVSEGLSVYYEYLMVKRAGLINDQQLFKNFENSINAFENDPGRSFQSLTQASYETWSDGPFGNDGKEGDRSISYYDKGPAVALLLDFAIRHATGNKKSLDDVMRFLYWQYYKNEHRGFTDAEFQQACETIAEKPLTEIFEYVYTTKELDYNIYLGYAGLKMSMDEVSPKRTFTIQLLDKTDALQQNILKSWLGE